MFAGLGALAGGPAAEWLCALNIESVHGSGLAAVAWLPRAESRLAVCVQAISLIGEMAVRAISLQSGTSEALRL